MNHDHSPNSPFISKIDHLVEFFSNSCLPLDFTSRIHQKSSIHLDFALLEKNCWAEFTQDLLQDPFNTIGCIKLALLEHYFRIKDTQSEIGQIFPRLENCSTLFLATFEELKSEKVGNFVMLRGTVARISQSRPVPIRMEFVCARCTSAQMKAVEDGTLNAPPLQCILASCKSRCFVPNKMSRENVLVERQRIKIQQISSQEQPSTIDSMMEQGGKIPKTFEVELEGDLINTVKPGDVVEVAGILRVAVDGKPSSILNLFLQANSLRLEGSKSKNASGDEDLICFPTHSCFSGKQEQQKQQSFVEPIPFEDLAASIAPSIFGNEMVKAGLLLCLLGGSENAATPGKRKDSHCLLIGDPGMGKSQMLCGIAKLCTRSVYVCGNTASNAGLTVSLVRETASNDFALEAGALLLADKGICCIDEFDKMSEFNSLLEAMEQQTVSIAKAGIVCSLPCRSTVIAAANPRGGHFDETKSCMENVNLDAAILTRFDLIFVLLDRPNSSFDRILSSHVIRGRREAEKPKIHEPSDSSSGSLLSMLRKGKALESDLVQTYIAFARSSIHPRLSREASDRIKEAYLRLRKKSCGELSSFPVTARFIESMIRLCEARAKASLSQSVTLQHAEEVIELFQHCLSTFHATSTLAKGKRAPKAANKRRFILALDGQFAGKSEFTTQELAAVAQQCQIEHFDEFLHLLNMNGFLLKTSAGNWKRI